jgi:hypothetical protein
MRCAVTSDSAGTRRWQGRTMGRRISVKSERLYSVNAGGREMVTLGVYWL